MHIIHLWWLPDWLALAVFVILVLASIICLFDRDPPEDEETRELRNLWLRLTADDWETFCEQEAHSDGLEADCLVRLREIVRMVEEFKALVVQLSDEDLRRFSERDRCAWNSQDQDKPASTEFLLARNARLGEFMT